MKNENMKAVTNLVGTKIFFDEAGYNQNVRLFTAIIYQVNAIIGLYKELPHNKRPIDKAFLTDLRNVRLRTMEAEMVAYGEAEIERLGIKFKSMIDSVRKDVYKDLAPITEAFKKYDTTLQTSQFSQQYTYTFDLDYLDVVDGEAVLTDEGKEKLKLVYSIFIEDEVLAAVWAAMQKTQTAFNELSDLLMVIGVPLYPELICSQRGFIHEGDDNQLQLHPQAIVWLKNFIAHKNRQKATA